MLRYLNYNTTRILLVGLSLIIIYVGIMVNVRAIDNHAPTKTTNLTESVNLQQEQDISENYDSTLEKINPINSITLDILNHSYVIEYITNPTCTEEGIITYRCNTCDEIIENTLYPFPHNYIVINRRNASHIYNGYVDYQCTVCKHSYRKESPTIPFGNAADTDLCGESLIETPLAHGTSPETFQQILSLYKLHSTIDDENNWFTLQVDKSEVKKAFIQREYRYLYYPIHYSIWKSPETSEYIMKIYDEVLYTEGQMKAYERAREIIDELNIDNTVAQKDAIIRINNWICDYKFYDYDALDGKSKKDGTPYASFFNPNGVCANYALLFQILCLTAGIECHYYASIPMNHAWNCVYFSDGTCLWVDTTWNDDRIKINGKYHEVSKNNCNTELIEEMRSKFLLLTYKEMLKTHEF